MVVWRSDNQEADGGYSGIYQQLFGDPAELPRQANPELNRLGGTLVFGENTVNAAPRLLDAVVSLHDADSADFDGGRVEIFYALASAAPRTSSVCVTKAPASARSASRAAQSASTMAAARWRSARSRAAPTGPDW